MRWILAAVVAVLAVSMAGRGAMAKRSAPKEVAAVVADGVEYRAPMGRERQGCVEAWDVKAAKQIWWRQVYVMSYEANLETDIQDVFITGMKVDAGGLIVSNERGGEYRVDLKTLAVQVRKGALVVGKR